MKTWTIALLVLSVLSAVAKDVVSDWSPAKNKVSLRVQCPQDLTAGGKGKLFWVKCEIRNEGEIGLWITNRARLFLTNDKGDVQRCLRRMARSKKDGVAEFNYVRFLKAGHTLSWWESGELAIEGDYTLHAVLDEVGAQTPPVRVSITFSRSTNAEATRVAALQRRFDDFPVLVPNTGIAEGTYRWVGFTNDPVVVDGELYYAFRFKAPEVPRKLSWSFIRNLNMSPVTWYIIPRQGVMQGFRRIDQTFYGVNSVPELARADDVAFIQNLPAASFKPGEEYLMWFSPQHGLPTGIMVSLNFPTSDSVDFRATPEAIQERNLNEPSEENRGK